jgi:regulator-associated protein of mTOR
VPKPTANGEIWVFNRNYTQYIPLSIYELQTWMGAPSIFVIDCSNAGLVVHWFLEFAKQREIKRAAREAAAAAAAVSPNGAAGASAQAAAAVIRSNSSMTLNDDDDLESPRADGGADAGGGGAATAAAAAAAVLPPQPKASILRDCILLAACSANQLLPTNPKWPVDIFTACLTTPVKVALRYSADGMLCGIDYDMIDKMPGKLTDRKTPLGELNWIFTAVTDTIAWLTLPRALFQRLFRQDLLVASLFRNFLLAARVLRTANCTPVSVPTLPDTYNHPMWHAWDLAADLCLAQLPQLVGDANYVYEHSPFFADQLTSFEVWLDHTPNPRAPPAQLPIVLQVLLSQTHRQRALLLLGRFLDIGAWAVNLALSVGIFPYVLKLLQSPVLELRCVLVFIWTKILALDKSCQLDLVKDNGHNYFINVLASPTVPPEQRTQAAFVLCCVMNHCRPGQQACLSSNLLSVALSQINDSNAQLRRWCVFCLGRLWEQHEDAKRAAVNEQAHERLCALLTDDAPEVRGAAVWALSVFVGGARDTRRANIELNIGLTLPIVTVDGSPLVRRELICALARLVQCFRPHFIGAYRQMLLERERERGRADVGGGPPLAAADSNDSPHTLRRSSQGTVSSSTLRSSSAASSAAAATSRVRGASPPPSSSSSSSSSAVAAGDASSVRRPKSWLPRGSAMSVPLSPSMGSTISPSPEEVSDAAAAAAGEASSALFATSELSIYVCLWKMVLALAQDPVPDLAQLASLIYNQVAEESQLQAAAEARSSAKLDASPNLGPSSGSPSESGSSGSSMLSPGSMRRGLSNFLRGSSAKQVPPLDLNGGAFHDDSPSHSPPGSLKYSSTMPPSSPPRAGAHASLGAAALGGSGGGGGGGAFGGAGGGSSGGVASDEDATMQDALQSTLFEWSAERFSQPLHETNASVDATSREYLAARWYVARNKEQDEKASQRQRRTPKRIDEQIAILKQPVGAVAKLLFHPTEDVLVVADDRDSINLWLWREGVRARTWTNSGDFHTRTTALTFINESDHALLLVGSHDGIVRLWDLRDAIDGLPPAPTSTALPTVADAPGGSMAASMASSSMAAGASYVGADQEGGSSGRRAVRLATAWRALSDAAAYSRRGGAGMVVSWQQHSGLLMVAGDVAFMRVWDAHHELAVQDVSTHASSSITCLASDQRGGRIAVAGCGDGTVRMFDWRVPPRYSHVGTMSEHQGWIVNVAMLPHDEQILSGSVTGEVKLWDVRAMRALRTYTTNAAASDVTTAVAVHKHDPVVAVGSQNQRIKVLSLTGEDSTMIRYHDG